VEDALKRQQKQNQQKQASQQDKNQQQSQDQSSGQQQDQQQNGKQQNQQDGSQRTPALKNMYDTPSNHENAHRKHEPNRNDERPGVGFCKMLSQCNSGNGYEKDQQDGKINPFGISSKDLGGFNNVQREEHGGRHKNNDV